MQGIIKVVGVGGGAAARAQGRLSVVSHCRLLPHLVRTPESHHPPSQPGGHGIRNVINNSM